MTLALSGEDLAVKLGQRFPESIIKATKDSLLLKSEALLNLASFLKTEAGLEFDYLSNMTATDYREYFEVVYQLTSLKHNHSLTLKVRCDDRNNPVLPSLVCLWCGANFQEREIYDLLGIKFEGHADLKRIFLWEGFQGHPLRKDFTDGA
jgi:NADH-quinone oxidoreductase subunit C